MHQQKLIQTTPGTVFQAERCHVSVAPVLLCNFCRYLSPLFDTSEAVGVNLGVCLLNFVHNYNNYC